MCETILEKLACAVLIGDDASDNVAQPDIQTQHQAIIKFAVIKIYLQSELIIRPNGIWL